MKSVAVILGLSCLLVLMVTPPASASGDNDVNDVSDKESYEKKERDKKDFRRYEDWGMDWSDADMMQHPIDEGPRRVSNTSSSTNFCILHKDPPHLLPSFLHTCTSSLTWDSLVRHPLIFYSLSFNYFSQDTFLSGTSHVTYF